MPSCLLDLSYGVFCPPVRFQKKENRRAHIVAHLSSLRIAHVSIHGLRFTLYADPVRSDSGGGGADSAFEAYAHAHTHSPSHAHSMSSDALGLLGPASPNRSPRTSFTSAGRNAFFPPDSPSGYPQQHHRQQQQHYHQLPLPSPAAVPETPAAAAATPDGPEVAKRFGHGLLA